MPVELRTRRIISFHDVAANVGAGGTAALAANNATVSAEDGSVGDWPTLATTGVPSGTSLTNYSGPNPITVDGTTVTAKTVVSTIDVNANNVTFQSCSIDSAGPIAVAVQAGKSNISFIDCDLVGGGFITAISGTTFLRCRSDPSIGHRVDDIVLAWSSVGHNGDTVLIRDCYLGPQWGFGPAEDPDHTDAIQMFGFGTVNGVTIDHCYIDSANVSGEPGSVPNGAGIFLADGTYQNVTITDNFFTRTGDVGGYFHLRMGSDTPSSGHVITGNRFEQQGTTDPIDLFQMTATTFSDNRYFPSLDLITS